MNTIGAAIGAVAFAIVIVGCVEALSPSDLARLDDAEALTLLAYKKSDAATPAAQFDRAAYCAIQGILREHDAARTHDERITCQIEKDQ